MCVVYNLNNFKQICTFTFFWIGIISVLIVYVQQIPV